MLSSKMLVSLKEAVLKIGLGFMVQITLPIGQLNLGKQEELNKCGFWQTGPNFLRKDIGEWPIKLTFQTDVLEGDLIPKSHHNSVKHLFAQPYSHK